MSKPKYYSLDRINGMECHYNMIIGERSAGKTYAVLKQGVENYFKDESTFAIIRRWEEDLRGKRGSEMFSNLVRNGEIERISGGRWTDVYYYSSRWFFCNYDENGKRSEISDKPFCYGFALSMMEHDKSTAYPTVTTILFDEFITRTMYLPEEFVLFTNVLSTIIRLRSNVRIYMCGNTISKYSPYFAEMGIMHIKEMTPGKIDIYEYGDSGLRVAVEFTGSENRKTKPSDVYFAFNNPKLQMITGDGSIWEMAIYPHCPHKYRPCDIRLVFFIEFNGDTLQCELVTVPGEKFIFIHRKTTPIQDPEHDIIFTPTVHPGMNYHRRITASSSRLEKVISSLFKQEKIFYSTNEVGEIVKGYLDWCISST